MRRLLYISILLFLCSNTYSKVRIIGIDPVNGIVGLKNYYTTDVNLKDFAFSYNNTDTSITKLTFILGDSILSSKEFVYIKVLGLNYTDGYLALQDLRYNQKVGDKNALVDYVQWGSVGHRF
ncbi:MAG: hypothetical protein HYZ42_15885, partial [Bacteroidetes bacterium]|nr:hypothetical protein [Bacteroidota bacterium]